MNTADKLLQLAEDRKKDAALSAEEAEELKKACQYIFSTSEGKIVARAMMRMSGIYKFPPFSSDPQTALRAEGLKYFYLFLIKGMLDIQTIMDIERQEIK